MDSPHDIPRPRRREPMWAAALLGSSAVLAGLTVPVAAQNVPAASSTTVAPKPRVAPSSTAPSAVPSTSLSTLPSAGSGDAAAAPDETTTTVPPLEADALLGAPESGSGTGAYSTQPLFDAGSRAVLGPELDGARRHLATAQRPLLEALKASDRLNHEQADLVAEFEGLRRGRAEEIDRAARSRARFRSRAAEAFVRGDQSLGLYAVSGDPVTRSRGSRFLEAIAGLDLLALRQYRAAISQLDRFEQGLARRQSDLSARLAAQSLVTQRAQTIVDDADLAVRAYAAGSHVAVSGFTFPVVGPANFIDSWGFPRLSGSADAHWHEGTDIMAPMGRELVAAENGVIERIGDSSLGGRSLWVRGASGTRFYYAHLSAFAPALVEGQPVTAGQVVGFVGNSGDAAGGPTHLHFEIHPAGAGPVNPFPLLRARWGERPVPTQSEALAGPGATLTPAVDPLVPSQVPGTTANIAAVGSAAPAGPATASPAGRR